MERRKFIKDGCLLCFAIGGSAALISLLESCSNYPVYKTKTELKKVKVPLSQFELSDVVIASPSDFPDDIALFKIGEGKYRALLMKCTHADNPVQFNGDKFRCNLHGSVFNRSGSVEKGPAEKPLIELTTSVENNAVLVSLK